MFLRIWRLHSLHQTLIGRKSQFKLAFLFFSDIYQCFKTSFLCWNSSALYLFWILGIMNLSFYKRIHPTFRVPHITLMIFFHLHPWIHFQMSWIEKTKALRLIKILLILIKTPKVLTEISQKAIFRRKMLLKILRIPVLLPVLKGLRKILVTLIVFEVDVISPSLVWMKRQRCVIDVDFRTLTITLK